jgi:hypothetical protein
MSAKELMFGNRPLIVQIAIVAAAFIVGTALGRWTVTLSQPAKVAATSEADLHAASNSTQKSAGAPSHLVPVSDAATSAPKAAAQKTLDQIMKGRNAGQRTKELEEFVKNLSASDIAAALKQLRQMPDSSARELASRLLVAHWLETDPNGALKFASENRDFDYIASDVFQQFAADDLQGALDRAKAISDPNLRYQALRGVLSFMADQDPLRALQLASTLGSFPNEEPLNQMIYRQWSATDPQAAAAAAALDSSNGGGWRSPVGQVLRNWASQDPLAALNWASALTDPASQAREIGQVIRQWSRDDFNAAANWVNTLAPGNTRDAAAAALAFSMAQTDLNSAIGWAQSIADSGQRDNALQRLSREIMFRDPTNGAALLAAAGVPANLIPPPQGQNGGGRGGGGRRGRP